MEARLSDESNESDGKREKDENMFYHQRALALLVGLEVFFENSLSTVAFGCHVFHKLVKNIGGISSLRQINPAVVFAAILFLSGKVSENVHTMASCITAAYDMTEMLGPDQPPVEKVSDVAPRVVEAEHAILRILAFDTTFTSPTKYIRRFIRELDLSRSVHDEADRVLKALLLNAEFLDYRSKALASGCVQRAMDRLGVSRSSKWYRDFSVDKGEFLAVSNWLDAVLPRKRCM